MNETKKQAIEAERNLSEFVTILTHSNKEFAKAVCRDHRYLQSEIFNLIIEVIKEIGNQENFDERNKFAVNKCKELSSLLN